jgi:hypothetical protein
MSLQVYFRQLSATDTVLDDTHNGFPSVISFKLKRDEYKKHEMRIVSVFMVLWDPGVIILTNFKARPIMNEYFHKCLIQQ